MASLSGVTCGGEANDLETDSESDEGCDWNPEPDCGGEGQVDVDQLTIHINKANWNDLKDFMEYVGERDGDMDLVSGGGDAEFCAYCFVDESSYCPRCNVGELMLDPLLQQASINPAHEQGYAQHPLAIFRKTCLLIMYVYWSVLLIIAQLLFCLISIFIWIMKATTKLFRCIIVVILLLIEPLFFVIIIVLNFTVWIFFQALTLVMNFVGNVFLVVWAMLLIVCLWFIYVSWLLSRAYVKLMSYSYKLSNTHSLSKSRGRCNYKTVKFLDYSTSFRKFFFISVLCIQDAISFLVDHIERLCRVFLGMFRKAVKFKYDFIPDTDTDSDNENCYS
jgi:hypothetical protein